MADEAGNIFDDVTGHRSLTIHDDSSMLQEIQDLRLSNKKLRAKLSLVREISDCGGNETVESLVKEWVSKQEQEANHNPEKTFTRTWKLTQAPYLGGNLFFDLPEEDSSKTVSKEQENMFSDDDKQEDRENNVDEEQHNMFSDDDEQEVECDKSMLEEQENMFSDDDKQEDRENNVDEEQHTMFSDDDEQEVECDKSMLEDDGSEPANYEIEGFTMLSTLIKYKCLCGSHYQLLLIENGICGLPVPVIDDEGSLSSDLPSCIWTETVDDRLIAGIHCTQCGRELRVVKGADFVTYWCTGF